jgi:esterase
MPENLFSQSYGMAHKASSPDAPSVVLIHGLFGNNDNLSVIRRHFETSHHVICIDLPDHGKSPHSAAFSFDAWAQQTINTIVSHDISKAYIVAHSLGGKVAMRIASLQAELVSKLVIMDIAPVSYEARHHNVINGLSAVKLAELSDRKQAMAQLSDYVHDPGTRSFLLKSLYQDDKKRWQWRFNLSLLQRDYPLLSAWPFDYEVFLGDVTFIKGKNSDYIKSEHQATIMQQFPNAKAKIVDAGHWMHAEKPQLINTLLTRILLGKHN